MIRLFIILLFLVACRSQVVKTSANDLTNIYATALNSYNQDTGQTYIIIDSTINEIIPETLFEQYMNDFFSIKLRRRFLDSSWIDFFKIIEDKKKQLRSIKLPLILSKSNTLKYVSNSMSSEENIFYRRPDPATGKLKPFKPVISFGNIITEENKAVVEMSFTCGMLCGEGIIFLLEKKNNQWAIVARMSQWVS